MNAGVRDLVKGVLERLKGSTNLASYRLFLKVVDSAVTDQLACSINTVGCLNPREANFCVVETDTTVARELVHILGYEEAPQELEGYELVMLHQENNRSVLEAFHELATEELRKIPPPNVESLKGIDDVCLLVAHLSYHYHLRLEHFALTITCSMATLLEEDIVASINCVDHLCGKLNIVQPGSLCYLKWQTLKESVMQIVKVVDTSSRRQLEELFMETARAIAAELAGRVAWSVAQVYVYTFSVQLIANLSYHNAQPGADNAVRYMEGVDVIAKVCPTDTFVASTDRVRQLLMKSLDGNINGDDMRQLAAAALWQTRNFIYHFQPNTLSTTGKLEGLARSCLKPEVDSEQLSIDPTAVHMTVPETANSSELSRSVREALMALKSVVSPYPYRLFMKIIDRCVINDLAQPAGSSDSLNPREMNICALDVETMRTRQFLNRIGFISQPGQRGVMHRMVMSDISPHRAVLTEFHKIAEEELRTTVCPGVEDLVALDNVPLLIAQLAYNLHFRVFLLTFTASKDSLNLLREDIYAGIDCVEYLALHLDIMQTNGDCRAAWYKAKQTIQKYTLSANQGEHSLYLLSELSSIHGEVSQQMDFELTLRVSKEMVGVFSYPFFVQILAQSGVSGDTLNVDKVFQYLDNWDKMPPNCMSERWVEGVEKIRQLLFKSFDEPLAKEEALKVVEISIWQSRNFIDHFQTSAINEVDSMAGQLLSLTRRTVKRREDGSFEVVNVSKESSSSQQCFEDKTMPPVDNFGSFNLSTEEELHEIEKKDLEKETSEIPDQPNVETEEHDDAPPPGALLESGDQLLQMSEVRQSVLQKEIDQLEEAMKSITGVAAIALHQAIVKKKSELELVEKFLSDLQSTKVVTQEKTSHGLITLQPACMAQTLKAILESTRMQASHRLVLQLVTQTVHFIPVINLTELMYKLGVTSHSMEAMDVIETIKGQLNNLVDFYK